MAEALRFDDYGRLIITFPDRMTLPAYTVSSDNGVLVISFETGVSGHLPDIPAILSGYISVSRFDPDMRSIRMGMRGPLQVHTIEAGEQLFIDLLPANWIGLPPSLPPETVARLAQRAEEAARIAEERRRAEMVEEYKPAATVRVGQHPTFARVQFSWNVGTRAVFTEEGDSAELKFGWPVPIDLYEIMSILPRDIVSAANTVAGVDSTIRFDVGDGVGLRFYEASATEFVLDIDYPHSASQGFDLASLAEEASQPLPAAASLAVAQDAEGGEGAVSEDAVRQAEVVPFIATAGATVRLVFPFEEETPAAVFKRGSTVWMVFDTTVPIAEPSLEDSNVLSMLAQDFTVERGSGSQVVRMTLGSDRLATMGSEGRSWVLSLGEVLLNAMTPITLDRRQTPGGVFEVTADLARPGFVHRLADPLVGDVLEVVTAYPPAQGIIREMAFVDFVAPRSIHGLVVRPLHNGVSVRLEEATAIISAEQGLTLSANQELRYRTPTETRVSALNLDSFIVQNPSVFNERRDEFMARAASTEGRELDRARLDLAQFYIANQLAHEALGVLRVLRNDLRQAALEPTVAIAIAAADTLAGRSEEALRALGGEALRDEADTMIWRTIANVEQGAYAAARLDAMGARAVIGDYPGWIRARFHLAASRAALEAGDEEFGAALLARVELSELNPDQLSDFQLLNGRLDELRGNSAEALQSYGRVIAADRRPTMAEAVLRTVRLLDRTGQLDVARAVDTLRVQSTLWRGDLVELEMVQTLGDLLYRNGDYREAFALTQQAAGTYGNSPVLNDLLDRAREEFANLYLNGRADSLDTVEALGIYYDYRHLTPAGADGDTMIRNLAQRLIEVDLLAQASELLAYQVDNRLEGAARAQVAADLAVVYIADRKPARALEVLHATRLAGLPPALERQRRVLEASALISANRQDLALDMLSSLTGRDTDLLRIDAMWKGKRYREASELIEMLYAADLERGQLSPVARMNIVKAAVGYVLAGDAIGISRLRSRYSDVMSQTPEWPMFAFVTEDVRPTGTEFREIAGQIAAVDSINAFLNAYREVYTAHNAIVPARAAPPGPA